MKQSKQKQETVQKEKYKTFQDEMFYSGIKNNLVFTAILLVYVIFFVEIPFTDLGYIILFAAVAAIVFQFFIAPFTNASYTRNISNLLISWKVDSLDSEQTTKLFIEVVRCPRIIMYYVFLLFGLATFSVIFLVYFFINISTLKLVFLFVTCIFASYVAGAIGLYASELICHRYARDIFKSNIDLKMLQAKKYYGVSIKTQFVLFIVLPVVFVTILTFVYLLSQKTILLKQDIFGFGKAVIFFISNSVIIIGLFLAYRNNVFADVTNIQYLLEWLSQTDFKTEKDIPITLAHELSYITLLIKNTIHRFPPIIDFHNSVSFELNERTSALHKYRTDLETISSTKYRLTDEIKKEIKTASNRQEILQRDVIAYLDMHDQLTAHVDQIEKIIQESKESTDLDATDNIDALRWFKVLETHVDEISEITSLLTDISEQIKIIAFNAELEATNAGSSGGNFLIIATEIRRLADYTMDSIIDTKKHIALLQDTARNIELTIQKKAETARIRKKFIRDIKLLLNTIKEKSEIKALDANVAKENKTQQEKAVNRILTLVEQLNRVLEESALYSYDISAIIEHFEHLANTIQQGEV